MKSVSLRIAFTCVSLAILSHSLLAAEPAAKPVAIGFQNRVFTDAAGQAPLRPLRARQGRPLRQAPVMLFLHGSGERGLNNLDPLMVGLGPAI